MLGSLAAFAVAMGVAAMSGVVLGYVLSDGNPAPLSVQITTVVLVSLLVGAPLAAVSVLIIAWPLDRLLCRLKRTSGTDYAVAGVLVSILALLLLGIFGTINIFAYFAWRLGWIPIMITGPIATIAFWKVVYGNENRRRGKKKPQVRS